jgi:hypothetical protein
MINENITSSMELGNLHLERTRSIGQPLERTTSNDQHLERTRSGVQLSSSRSSSLRGGSTILAHS